MSEDAEINGKVAGAEQGDTRSGKVGRRALMIGVAAAGAGAAVSVVAGAKPAAADGTAVILGQSNGGTNVTEVSATTGNGFGGYTSNDGSSGVAGYSSAASGGIGAYGQSLNGTGVSGLAKGTTGYGVEASGGQAQLRLVPTSAAGAPTGGTHLLGELYVDDGGNLYLYRMIGSAASWVKMSSPLVLLSAPHRVYDSRSTGGAIAGGATREVSMVTGGFVPTGASAVLMNLAVTDTSGAGFLAVYAAGATWGGTANINYGRASTIANSVTSSVNTAGMLTVQCGTASTQFIIDVVGYYP